MSWITEAKGAGPWAFQEQAAKQGYVNNPRWTATPASLIEHQPCGYWRKTAIPTPVTYQWFGWGNNGQYALGQYGVLNQAIPVHLAIASTFKSLVALPSSSAGIGTDGQLYNAGYNFNGELGNGSTSNKLAFSAVDSAIDWLAVGGCVSSCLATKTDGTLWGTGENYIGQLGLGYAGSNKLVFTQAPGTDWSVPLHTFGLFTVAQKQDGSYWATGANGNGQFGNGGTTSPSSFVQIHAAGAIQRMACGGNHTVILKPNGTIWAAGWNHKGQLGQGDTTQRTSYIQIGSASDWVFVGAGVFTTFAIKSNGTLWACGENGDGALGLGFTSPSQLTLVQVGTDTDWVYIAGGHFHTMGIKGDGSYWGSGRNSNGQLGIAMGDQTDRTVFTKTTSGGTWAAMSLGGNHTLAFRVASGGVTPPPAAVNPVWPMPA